ncbi:MAG TPA: TonB-dependent receptor plug domain-containing protein, partial [Labilithrix sp.]|nr:TonB-dependent receptor plug domain-containing protein [Labilithrix sp.]
MCVPAANVRRGRGRRETAGRNAPAMLGFGLSWAIAVLSLFPGANARADSRIPEAERQGANRANETTSGDDSESEDEVVVRGRQQAAGFVSRARIEESPRTVTDAASLIEPLPGVHVRRLGADDSFATLSIRGSSSTQVAVYLAGVPLSGGADPTLDLATLPLWPFAAARVHRTFAPAALGRGSLGGTLVIDPPSPRAPAGTEVWLAAGSFGSRRLRIGDVRGEPNGVRIASGVSASRSDDDFTFFDQSASEAVGREVLAKRRNAGHAAAAGLASVGIPVRFGTRSGALTVTALAQARRQELPGPARSPTAFQRLDSSRLVSALEFTLPASRDASFVLRGWGRREGLSVR